MIPGQILIGSALFGGFLGWLGSRKNGVATSDESTLWVLAGILGGPLAVAEWTGLLLLSNRIVGWDLPAPRLAVAVLLGAGALGAWATPRLDAAERPAAWAASLAVKWIRSPLATTAGFVMCAVARARHRRVNFARGMLFVEVGPGNGALTLGGVAWCRTKCFRPRDRMFGPLAAHESVHSRTVAAVGELGFYLTYVTLGAIWGRRQGGSWNNLTREGCGQPFEKTAHTFTKDPAVARRCKPARGREEAAAPEQMPSP